MRGSGPLCEMERGGKVSREQGINRRRSINHDIVSAFFLKGWRKTLVHANTHAYTTKSKRVLFFSTVREEVQIPKIWSHSLRESSLRLHAALHRNALTWLGLKRSNIIRANADNAAIRIVPNESHFVPTPSPSGPNVQLACEIRSVQGMCVKVTKTRDYMQPFHPHKKKMSMYFAERDALVRTTEASIPGVVKLIACPSWASGSPALVIKYHGK